MMLDSAHVEPALVRDLYEDFAQRPASAARRPRRRTSTPGARSSRSACPLARPTSWLTGGGTRSGDAPPAPVRQGLREVRSQGHRRGPAPRSPWAPARGQSFCGGDRGERAHLPTVEDETPRDVAPITAAATGSSPRRRSWCRSARCGRRVRRKRRPRDAVARALRTSTIRCATARWPASTTSSATGRSCWSQPTATRPVTSRSVYGHDPERWRTLPAAPDPLD
jgi:hypothetical protein